MCYPFNEVARGENLNDYYLKYLTSAPSVASGRRLWTRGAGSISSSGPLNVHFSIGIGYSHVKERNFLPGWLERDELFLRARAPGVTDTHVRTSLTRWSLPAALPDDGTRAIECRLPPRAHMC